LVHWLTPATAIITDGTITITIDLITVLGIITDLMVRVITTKGGITGTTTTVGIGITGRIGTTGTAIIAGIVTTTGTAITVGE